MLYLTLRNVRSFQDVYRRNKGQTALLDTRLVRCCRVLEKADCLLSTDADTLRCDLQEHVLDVQVTRTHKGHCPPSSLFGVWLGFVVKVGVRKVVKRQGGGLYCVIKFHALDSGRRK